MMMIIDGDGFYPVLSFKIDTVFFSKQLISDQNRCLPANGAIGRPAVDRLSAGCLGDAIGHAI